MAGGGGAVWKSGLAVLLALALTQGFAYLNRAADKDDHFLQVVAAIAIAIQWIEYLHASGLIFGNERTDKYYDLTGSFTFLFCMAAAIYRAHDTATAREWILVALVVVWAVRLGYYLFRRSLAGGGGDPRFSEIKKCLAHFFAAWTLQGVWVFLTSLPVLTLLNETYVRGGQPLRRLGALDYVGIFIWLLGFGLECVADLQKAAYRKRPRERQRHPWCDEGLWYYSRHPNYFGEIVLWIGVYLCAMNGMHELRLKLVSLISPIWVALQIIFASGIPILEKMADEKFGHLEEYKDFKARTPVLIPFLPSSRFQPLLRH